jgi:hypothetical protein
MLLRRIGTHSRLHRQQLPQQHDHQSGLHDRQGAESLSEAGAYHDVPRLKEKRHARQHRCQAWHRRPSRATPQPQLPVSRFQGAFGESDALMTAGPQESPFMPAKK